MDPVFLSSAGSKAVTLAIAVAVIAIVGLLLFTAWREYCKWLENRNIRDQAEKEIEGYEEELRCTPPTADNDLRIARLNRLLNTAKARYKSAVESMGD